MDVYSHIPMEELVRRCSASGEIAAWEEFVRRFHPLIAKVVLRAAVRLGDASKETVDDLIQETYIKFCADDYRLLRDFEHRHTNAFAGYVQVVAANVVRDHFKSRYSQKRGSNRTENTQEDSAVAAAEDSSGSPGGMERAVLIQEVQLHLDICISGADQGRNSKVFWLYYRAGLSAAAIATLPGIGLSAKGVESLVLRLTRELRGRMTARAPQPQRMGQASGKGILPAGSF